MRLLPVLPLALMLAPLAAQQPEVRLMDALHAGDRHAVEAARRQMVVGELSEGQERALRSLLEDRDELGRAVALSVLIEHDRLSVEESDALARGYDSVSLRRMLMPVVGASVARELFEGSDDSFLRALAWSRFVELGAADDESWAAALDDDDDYVQQAAARLLVYSPEPLSPRALRLLSPAARRAVLRELAQRPRHDADAWLLGLGQRDDLDELERLLRVYAATDPDLSRIDVGTTLDALLSGDSELAGQAGEVCALMPAEIVDRWVAEVHARAVDGADLHAMLPALENVSAKGRLHLVALARALELEQRMEILDWLNGRDDLARDALVRDALEGRDQLEPEVLRLTSVRLLEEEPIAALLRGLLADQTADRRLRIAAFEAMVAAGYYSDELLAFALESPSERQSSCRRLLSMPTSSLPGSAWRALLGCADRRVRMTTLSRMAEEPLLVDNEELLLGLIDEEGPVGMAAAEVCLRAGAPAFATRVWEAQSGARRERLAVALRYREADWALPLLRAEPLTASSLGLLEARIVLGDREALDRVLAAPLDWPGRYFVRLRSGAPALLVPTDLPRIEGMLLGAQRLDSEVHRLELLGWLAARPDLGARALLERVRETGEPEERDAALHALLAIEEVAHELRAELEARLAAGLDLWGRELAYEVAGSLQPPLAAEGARLIARMAVVEPLAQTERELALAVGDEQVGRSALRHLVWQQLGRQPTVDGSVAMAAAVRESLEHPQSYLASRARLGELMAIFAREPRSRALFGASLATALLAAPDLDQRFTGPAHLLLAEAAEAEGRYAAAAEHWDLALKLTLRWMPKTMRLRAFVGDGYLATGEVWPARMAGHAELCRARLALAAGERQTARESARRALALAVGDRGSVALIESFLQEIER